MRIKSPLKTGEEEWAPECDYSCRRGGGMRGTTGDVASTLIGRRVDMACPLSRGASAAVVGVGRGGGKRECIGFRRRRAGGKLRQII